LVKKAKLYIRKIHYGNLQNTRSLDGGVNPTVKALRPWMKG